MYSPPLPSLRSSLKAPGPRAARQPLPEARLRWQQVLQTSLPRLHVPTADPREPRGPPSLCLFCSHSNRVGNRSGSGLRAWLESFGSPGAASGQWRVPRTVLPSAFPAPPLCISIPHSPGKALNLTSDTRELRQRLPSLLGSKPRKKGPRDTNFRKGGGPWDMMQEARST